MMRTLTFVALSILILSFTTNEKGHKGAHTNLVALKKEIELRLLTYENHLQNGDSMAQVTKRIQPNNG